MSVPASSDFLPRAYCVSCDAAGTKNKFAPLDAARTLVMIFYSSSI
jgi:hypothetical protein